MNSNFYKFTVVGKKIAAFDLDGTLINPKSKSKFPKDKDDYKYAFNNVDSKLKELMENGYKIVIFTNQNGIEKKKTSLKDIVYKIEKLFPFADYFISDKDDLYRKPMPGMYHQFIELNGHPNEIFYVGDAAGRKEDHSSSDINFAHNSRINFKTQSEFFKNIKENIKPKCILLSYNTNDIKDVKEFNNNVVVIMQGFPGCGKTEFIKEYVKYNKIKEYLHLSNDEYTKSKLMKLYKKGLNDEVLIFIDNLNATKKNREEFIKLLPEHYLAVGVHIKTPFEIAFQLNKERYYDSNIDSKCNGKVRKKVPKVVYNIYKKRFENMAKSEGFHKIISFMPKVELKYCF
tara:strand:+ start:1612 stop:2643 length:1032 start_codon:yes stop_codon:yes gene_type:complete